MDVFGPDLEATGMDLSTTYMGFHLPHPLVPGASPLADSLDTVRRLEDAGAPMIVLRSLFEEQIIAEELATFRALDEPDYSFAEALSYLPWRADFKLGPHEYLDHLRRIKEAVEVPVIGSLNGTTEGGWLSYARAIQQAGADGLELNLYELAADLDEPGEEVERRALAVVESVRQAVTIPIAVKLSPFYSSIAHFARRLDNLGVDAIILFNRFYQPDIDVEQREVVRVNLSNSSELLLRLRWLGMLYGRLQTSLVASGGVHTAIDAIKALMAGADVVQLVAALLKYGPAYLKELRTEMERWLAEHEYQSLGQLRGSMSLLRCSDPKAYERANYIKILQSWER